MTTAPDELPAWRVTLTYRPALGRSMRRHADRVVARLRGDVNLVDVTAVGDTHRGVVDLGASVTTRDAAAAVGYVDNTVRAVLREEGALAADDVRISVERLDTAVPA